MSMPSKAHHHHKNLNYDEYGNPFFYFKNGERHFLGAVYDPARYRRKLFNINPICQLCREAITRFKDATLDHIRPRAHGGRTIYSNLQLAHRKCNSMKGSDYSV